MARIATGVSKKSNRENLKALDVAFAWKRQFGIGVKMDAEFAWVVSNGKFGTKPVFKTVSRPSEMVIGEATIDTFKVAKYVSKMEGGVA